MVTCPVCGSDDLDLVEVLHDQRRRIKCVACDHVWDRGEAKPPPKQFDSYAAAKARFPGRDQVDPGRLERVNRLKAQFLRSHPAPQPEVATFWARYQAVFSEDGLAGADPADLHYFANVETGARPGNMAVFNLEWKAIGPDEGARRVRESVGYLLYGPEEVPLEDRLTRLLEPGTSIGMKGWKESLLTKVLCIMQPDRFLPILTYSTINGGKKELAKQIWGLDFPDANRVSWTLGRLILWSNDVLVQLAGDGFTNVQHVSEFLWMAKDEESLLRG